MKILSNARANFLAQKIGRQADIIHNMNSLLNTLEQENIRLAERVAGLEALLYSTGVMDREDFEASDEEKAWLASVMLARGETPSVSSADTSLREGGKEARG